MTGEPMLSTLDWKGYRLSAKDILMSCIFLVKGT